ncbi:MAG: long-chain fatty acid--CoA ligase [Solirubrobacteraceae bacterium]|nr:long-chain fatty acid--CoA ligase [Solirubrobacteraceae bacterium]
MRLNLASLLDQAAKRHPEQIYVRLGDVALNYATVNGAAQRVASYLQSIGVKPGDRVGVMLPNVPHFPMAYYGALLAGAVVVPMNVLLKGREVEYYLQDSGSKALIAWAGFGADAKFGADAAGVPLLVAGPDETPEGATKLEEAIGTVEPLTEPVQRVATDTAVILYTSGTTGKPKGALLTHSNLMWNAEISSQLHDLGTHDTLLGALPLFHSFGQTCVLNAAARRGATIELIPRFDPELALGLIEKQKVTKFFGVPTMFVALLNHPNLASTDVSSLDLCVSGGSACAVETLKQAEEKLAPVLEGYGLSETSPVACFNHKELGSKPGSIGTPLYGVEMDIRDDEGNSVADGEVGEIVIRGHNVMAGYHERPEATAEAIDDLGWFKTGDMATRDADGYYFIVDRKKDLVIRGGYNVYPREIEEVLYEHPAILEAAVLGVPHEELGEEIAAAVAAKPGQTLDPAEVQAFVKERVAAYKYPRHVVIVDELPKTATGKILKREIDKSIFDNATV